MNPMIEPLLDMEEYRQLLEAISAGQFPLSVTGLSESQKMHFIYSLQSHAGKRICIITYNELQAKRMTEDLSFFYGDRLVFFPARELLLYDVEAKSHDLSFQRLQALYRIVSEKDTIIVSSVEALLHRLMPPGQFNGYLIKFKVGNRIQLEELKERLILMGYERVEVVEGKGQFSIRGGIIDIFSVQLDNAVRIELFDDEIDSIRIFDVTTQRSVEQMDEVTVLPAGEILFDREKAKEFVKQVKAAGRGLTPHIKEDLEKFRSHHYFPGMDRYIPLIYKEENILLDYLDNDTLIILDEISRIRQRAENVQLEWEETAKTLLEKGTILPSCMQIFVEYRQIFARLRSRHIICFHALSAAASDFRPRRTFNIEGRLLNTYQGHPEILIEDIRLWKSRKYRILILAGAKSRGERLRETLRENGIECSFIDKPVTEILPSQVIITCGALLRGFEYPLIQFVVISDKDFFGQNKKPRRVKARKDAARLKTFTDLKIGDYVVHQHHGIGVYVGIQQLVVDGVTRDYLKIQYYDGDYLYVPTSQMDAIQKYIGSEGHTPRINKLGGSDWQRTKKRVKESLKELAAELIKIYAARQAKKGHAFSKDTVWQAQFEETFPYEETADQLRCIQEVKEDMESPRPMDRLLCGDVGYGKTEVALRAAFKAAMDGKQTAYLVPTTILAQQHYNNFVQRLRNFPVKVEMISRFRTTAEIKRILKEVKAGTVDILIGTHRLIQKDVQFKDLGLLIIDEEQRFGVAHKEKLKSIKENIDVLTLTATPIPRTLHMSLTGIRDMSIIEEPPEERYPVQTYVMEYNPEVIRDAIIRELSRNGQVYYLYNRVRSIKKVAADIQKLVPDARVAVAHGQMDEEELENVMFSFLNGEYDVLVCTTIIESGLDIPNVNTIIVEDADRLGLAQLYQIRGRVGRSNRLAYAYITYKKDKQLTEEAEKRLQAIKEFTEFGSGFKIAMRDLEIRGAGNLLGPEQHGHMEAVGYEMYCRLLDEAVKELTGGAPTEEEIETTVDINCSAYIPDDYIGNENQKIEMYKKIAAITDDNDRADVLDELLDRYGELPDPVLNLIEIASIKSLAQRLGFSAVTEKGDLLILQYASGKFANIDVIGKIMNKYPKQILFTASNTPYLSVRIGKMRRDEYLTNIKILLQDMKRLMFGV